MEAAQKTERVRLPWHQRFSYITISAIEHFYYLVGKFVANRPFTIIGATWAFVLLSGLGFLRFYQETDVLNLWVPSKSQFILDSKRLANTYKTNFEVEEVIIKATNVLSSDVLLKAYEMDKNLKKASAKSGVGWENICFRVPKVDRYTALLSQYNSLSNGTKLQEALAGASKRIYCAFFELKDTVCYEKSLLQLWGHNPETIGNLTDEDILQTINNPDSNLLLGNVKSYQELLGGVRKNESGYITSATALKMFWVVHSNATGEGDKQKQCSLECLWEWEDVFIDVMENASQTYRDIEIYYHASKSFTNISSSAMNHGIQKLMVGAFIMLLYVQFVISKFNWVEARLILGFFGLLSVAMAFFVAIGLCSLFGVYYTPVHSSLPFLLMGLGVDDMFVIVASWEQLAAQDKLLPLNERVGIMLKHAGVSITVTTVTDVLAFAAGLTTVLPCLQSYCIYAGVGVLMTLMLQVTFFVACFVLDQKRIELHYGGVIPWKKYQNYSNKCSESDLSRKIIHFVYSKIILTWPGKIITVGIALAFFSLSICGIFNLKQHFDLKWFIPKYTYLGQFFEQESIFYPSRGYQGKVYVGAVNYSHEFTNIYNMVEQLYNSSDVIEVLSSWVKPFDRFVASHFNRSLHSIQVSDSEFKTYLSDFLFSPEGSVYQGNFMFVEDLKCGSAAPDILMSNVVYRFKMFQNQKMHVSAMHKVQDIAKNMNLTTGDKFSTSWSYIYGTWIADEVIEDEVIRNILLAVAAVMACTLVLIANIQICFWIFLTVGLTISSVSGFMQYWGQNIDMVSSIGLQLSIGFSVDYAIHIGFTFLTTSNGSRNERAIQTVTYIGAAVLYGGCSTLIAVAMLGFGESYSFQVFFRIFLLVIIFGLYHGLLLLPVILSWFGPKSYRTYLRKS